MSQDIKLGVQKIYHKTGYWMYRRRQYNIRQVTRQNTWCRADKSKNRILVVQKTDHKTEYWSYSRPVTRQNTGCTADILKDNIRGVLHTDHKI